MTHVHRTDKDNFPYEAYHFYCSPGDAEYPEEPYNFRDPYSNPQPQDILQISSSSLGGLWDTGSPPAERYWSSDNLGIEIYMAENQFAEWSVKDFDIIIPDEGRGLNSRNY
ncbi:hypothetical protein Sango_2485500 [Sesamum angolense]|uniref:DUF7705 domain-containing protein n=1 Tax=Sesamum angolense TaxID=2727404 RepID=A0AAE2BI09_9LAMI|nr:hypothetical protein Sango_2485500 [Sesamum angolense]